MKYFLFLFIFIFSINLSFSQTQWWAEQNSGVTTALTSVSVSGCVWVCGYSGVVLRTGNSGTTWLNVSGGGIPNNVQLINILGIDCNTALVAGYVGTTNTWVWKTTNAGVNWVQVFNQPNGFIDAITKRGYNTGKLIMVGDPVGGRWSIWQSTNLGTSWDSAGMYLPQNGTESGFNNSLYWNSYYSDSSIWFGTNNSRIYRSTTNGTSWIAQSTGAEQNSYAVNGMWTDLLVGGATELKSINLGNNWTTVTAPGTGNFGGFVVFGVPVDNINTVGASWFVRSDNKIYTGFDGNNWTVQFTAPAGNYRHISTSLGTYGGPIWAVRDNGGISACVSCNVSGVVPSSGEIPNEYSLKQNYPNPFNPTTTFEFAIPTASHVKLCIYNSIGEQVDVLTESNLNAGTYSAHWDASRFASGVYFYTLFATGEGKTYSNTKKLVLIK